MSKVDEIKAALLGLLNRDQRNTCQHEETHRGGAIWEICNSCGAKWADDEGGKPEWVDPPEWGAGYAAIAALETLAQPAGEAAHPAVKPDMLVNAGALKMALNVLRRAGKDEVADELEKTAQPAGEAEPVGVVHGSKYARHRSEISVSLDYFVKPGSKLYTAPPKAQPLTDKQIEKGRESIFSTSNPFCPCDSKTMQKVVRWAEAAHGIKKGNTE